MNTLNPDNYYLDMYERGVSNCIIPIYIEKDNFDVKHNHYLLYREYIENFCKFVSIEEKLFIDIKYSNNTLYNRFLKYTNFIKFVIYKFKYASEEMYESDITIKEIDSILKTAYELKKFELQKIIHSEDVCNYIIEYLIDFKKYDKFISEISDRLIYNTPFYNVFSRKKILYDKYSIENNIIIKYVSDSNNYMYSLNYNIYSYENSYLYKNNFFRIYYDSVKNKNYIETIISVKNQIVNYFNDINNFGIIQIKENNILITCKKHTYNRRNIRHHFKHIIITNA